MKIEKEYLIGTGLDSREACIAASSWLICTGACCRGTDCGGVNKGAAFSVRGGKSTPAAWYKRKMFITIHDII
jgi:hypothetical protein